MSLITKKILFEKSLSYGFLFTQFVYILRCVRSWRSSSWVSSILYRWRCKSKCKIATISRKTSQNVEHVNKSTNSGLASHSDILSRTNVAISVTNPVSSSFLTVFKIFCCLDRFVNPLMLIQQINHSYNGIL